MLPLSTSHLAAVHPRLYAQVTLSGCGGLTRTSRAAPLWPPGDRQVLGSPRPRRYHGRARAGPAICCPSSLPADPRPLWLTCLAWAGPRLTGPPIPQSALLLSQQQSAAMRPSGPGDAIIIA